MLGHNAHPASDTRLACIDGHLGDAYWGLLPLGPRLRGDFRAGAHAGLSAKIRLSEVHGDRLLVPINA